MPKPATNAEIAVGIAMGLYQRVSFQYIFVEPLEHQNIHLAFALVLSFLNALKTSKKRWFSFLLLAMILLSLLSTAYVQVFYHELQTRVMRVRNICPFCQKKIETGCIYPYLWT